MGVAMRALKFLLILIIILVALYVGAYLFVSIKGKDILQAKLEQQLKRPVTVQGLTLGFPFRLQIQGLDIEGLGRIEDMSVSPSLAKLLTGRVVLNELSIKSPQLNIERQRSGKIEFFPLGAQDKNNPGRDNPGVDNPGGDNPSGDDPPAQNENNPKGGSLLLSNFVIQDGTLNFKDKNIDPSGFNIRLSDINIEVKRFSLPALPLKTEFKISANIFGGDATQPAGLDAQGWIDLLKKDMDGTVSLTGVNLTDYQPYCRKYLLSEVRSGGLQFNSQLKAENNDLTADCVLEIENLTFKTERGLGQRGASFLGELLGNIESGAQKVKLDFVIKTKLDNPKIDFAQITGSFVQKAAEKKIKDTVKGAIERAIIGQPGGVLKEGIGNILRGTLEGILGPREKKTE
jgi:uncharacterized protein involved in outer membrane biogenesis